MPYDKERKNYLGQVKIANDKEFVEAISDFNIGKEIDPDIKDELSTVEMKFDDVTVPETLYAIDGSRIETEVKEDSYIGIIEISIVKIDVNKLTSISTSGYVNPVELDKCYESDHLRVPLPSSGLYKGKTSPRDAWREIIHKTIKEQAIFGFSLQQAYLELINNAKPEGEPYTKRKVCPSCKKKPPEGIKIRADNFDQFTLTCSECGSLIYPTDRIGVSSNVSSRNQNVDQLNSLMEVFEHIITLAIYMEASTNTAILKDGPLASFVEGGWIARSLRNHIWKNRGGDPLLIGIQKTGDFKIFADKIKEDIEAGSIVELSQEFIEVNIKAERDVEGVYGEETYYGKNFIYKTQQGYIFSYNVPRKIYQRNDLKYKVSEFRRMDEVVSLFENLQMFLYEDSLIPIHKAHDAATISENLGGKILSRMSQEKISD